MTADERRAQLLDWLNRSFSPWTFDGSEPATVELFALVDSFHAEAQLVAEPVGKTGIAIRYIKEFEIKT